LSSLKKCLVADGGTNFCFSNKNSFYYELFNR
jgi:hypothetical protein